MLSVEDNELLTQTGPGTPLGTFMRQYWIPAVGSSELSPDGVPYRIRLLGEDLLAFRDSDGNAGIIEPYCAHRRAPLFFGRNEESGIRCVYHGWKFDVAGRCMDMPNEPAESTFKDKVSIGSYPVREQGGVVWVYMGGDEPPALPALEWASVDAAQVHVSFRVQECNWLQALEGEIDSSHGPFLHSRIDGRSSQAMSLAYSMQDRRPRFEVLDTDYGVAIAARREADEENYYWRIQQYLFPFWTMVPPGSRYPTIGGHAWVPIDDNEVLAVCFSYHPVNPLADKINDLFHHGTKDGRETGHLTSQGKVVDPNPLRPYNTYRSRHNPGNDYNIDWEDQRTQHFSGLPGPWPQDAACQTGMGPVVDRTKEHLGSTDAGIVRVRRSLKRAVTKLTKDGLVPASAVDPTLFAVRSVGMQLPREADWVEGTAPHRQANGQDFAYSVPS